MPTKIIFSILLYSSFSFACKMGPTSKWNLSEGDLKKFTSNVVVAKLVNIVVSNNGLADLKFQIIETKKGRRKKMKSYIFEMFRKQTLILFRMVSLVILNSTIN
ncbi:hypothetical protein CIK05_06700 [Bdellovibrio sp. qaytius]|nr:hypothetical protein CIK05_06700 [Bdellovibrio sp. qaytius]